MTFNIVIVSDGISSFIILLQAIIVLDLTGVVLTSVSFVINQRHLLSLIISLEGLMLSLLILILGFQYEYFIGSYMFLMLIRLAACEASLGLSLLIRFIHLRGSRSVSRNIL